MRGTESSLQLRMFSGTPADSVWSSVSGMCWGAPGTTSAVPGPGIWKCCSSCVVSRGLPGSGCRITTDGQLDIHDKAFWCHPHATYASPCGYDFLEIAFSQSLTAVAMATQSQLLRTDLSVHKHTHTLTLKPSWIPKASHGRRSKDIVVYYFISLTHSGNARQWGTAITFS